MAPRGWHDAAMDTCNVLEEVMGGEDGVGHPAKDAAGQVSWHHVVNMLKAMETKHVAFENRQHMNGAWRRVMVVVWDGDAGDAQLLDEQLKLINKHDTPDGSLHLFELGQTYVLLRFMGYFFYRFL